MSFEKTFRFSAEFRNENVHCFLKKNKTKPDEWQVCATVDGLVQQVDAVNPVCVDPVSESVQNSSIPPRAGRPGRP